MKPGWTRQPIAALSRHNLGKMLDRAKNRGEMKPYLRNLNVRWFDFDLTDVLQMRFESDEVERYTVRKGDLVICEGGYPGRAAVWDDDEPVYIQKALHRVRFHEPVHARWCLYYLLFQDAIGKLRAHFNGAGIQHFTGEALAKFEIPVPPVSDVTRIVAILDEAFEGIAAAKANAEKNLQNARELLESHLGATFAQQGEVVPLAKCATDISDGDHAPPPKSPTGVPFITISNVDKETRRIDFSDTFNVPRTYFDALKPHRKPKRGDVLYTVTGSFGIPILVEDEGEFCFQRHIGLIRPKHDVDSRWLMYALLSPHARAQAEAGATGTAQRTVSLGVLRAMTVPKVGVEEQRRTAAQMDALSDEVERLKRIARARSAALDELKKSLLHQAFTGAL